MCDYLVGNECDISHPDNTISSCINTMSIVEGRAHSISSSFNTLVFQFAPWIPVTCVSYVYAIRMPTKIEDVIHITSS